MAIFLKSIKNIKIHKNQKKFDFGSEMPDVTKKYIEVILWVIEWGQRRCPNDLIILLDLEIALLC